MNKINCTICQKEFEIEKYGLGTCHNCGTEHQWEEGFFPTFEELETFGQKLKSITELKSVLEELVALKIIKDRDGKTDYYLKNQPLAWERANNLLNKLSEK